MCSENWCDPFQLSWIQSHNLKDFRISLQDSVVPIHTKYFDVFYLGKKSILKVVLEGTSFQSTKQIPNIDVKSLRNGFKKCRFYGYFGTSRRDCSQFCKNILCKKNFIPMQTCYIAQKRNNRNVC